MIWTALGWLGQSAFFARSLSQWIASERAGRSVSPASFWWLSLLGTTLLAAYAISAREFVLAGGYLAGAWIYTRNLSLLRRPRRGRKTRHLLPEAALLVSILALGTLAGAHAELETPIPWLWFGVSVVGQSLWTARFVVQWIVSRRAGRSHFPNVFWSVALAGNVLLLAYAIHRLDLLLICAFALGPVVQIRNLALGEGHHHSDEFSVAAVPTVASN